MNTIAEQHRKASISSSSVLSVCAAWVKLRILTDGKSVCSRNTSLCYLRRKTYVKKWNRAYLTYDKIYRDTIGLILDYEIVPLSYISVKRG